MSETKRVKKKSGKPVIGKDEALDILASALAYCQQSGLTVQAGNVDRAFVIKLLGVRLDESNGSARLMLGTTSELPAMPADVPAMFEDLPADY